MQPLSSRPEASAGTSPSATVPLEPGEPSPVRGITPERCDSCAVRTTALCGSLGDDDLAALRAIARPRRIRAGQVLIWAGDPPVLCATLVTGVLKVVRDGPDGRPQIVGLLYPGDLVGEVFVDQAQETVAALTDAELCVYPRAALEPVLRQHPAAERWMLAHAMSLLGEARRWMLLLARRRAAERVAAFVLDMARRLGDADSFDLPLGRAAIAEVLGLRVETVSRQLSALRLAGMIALPGGRRITLLDRAGLTQAAG